VRELSATTLGEPGGPLLANREIQRAPCGDTLATGIWRVRVFDGLQTAMAPIGLLAGYRDVHSTLQDAEISQFLAALLTEEIVPSLHDHHAYGDAAEMEREVESLVGQLAATGTRRYLDAISRNSLTKWQTRSLPVLRSAWAHGRGAQATIFAFAALAVLYAGQGVDAATARKAGFCAADNEAMLALMRSMFPGPDATLAQLERWLRDVVDAAGYFAPDETPGAARFSAAAAPIVHAILRDGIRAALRTMNLPAQTLPMPEEKQDGSW